MGEKEDAEKTCGDTECVHPHCWGIRGYEVGQMILAKKVKEAIRERSHNNLAIFPEEVIEVIDNLLKESAED